MILIDYNHGDESQIPSISPTDPACLPTIKLKNLVKVGAGDLDEEETISRGHDPPSDRGRHGAADRYTGCT